MSMSMQCSEAHVLCSLFTQVHLQLSNILANASMPRCLIVLIVSYVAM
jgi:hypothetical protein